MRRPLVLSVALGMAGAALPAIAAENACVRAFGDKLVASEVEVSIGDGLITPIHDVQALTFLAKQATPEQKARFDRFVAGRRMSDDQAAERLTEFLATENIADRLKDDGAASRRVRLAIAIDAVKFPVMKMPLGPVIPILNTTMSGTFKVQDAESRAVLCEGRIINSVAFAQDNLEGRKRNAVKVLNFGRDDHFQTLVGAGNGLARDAQALLRDADLGRISVHRVEGVEVQQATFEIRVSQPATSQEP